MKLNLSFSAIDCLRCGMKRQVRLACPDCNAKPAITEVDVRLQFRQRAVRATKLTRQSECDELGEGPLELLSSSRLSDLVDQVSAAASLVAEEAPSGPEALDAAAKQISALEKWVEVAPELRPLASYSRYVKCIASGIVDFFDCTLSALEAPSIQVAQRIEVDVQRALDTVTNAASEGGLLIERIDRITNASNPCAAWMNEAFEGDAMTAAAKGADLLRQHGLPSNNLEAQLLAMVWDVSVRTISDADRFWSAVSHHHKCLKSHNSSVVRIVEAPEFVQLLAETREDALNAARRAMLAGEPETLRQEITELLDTGHQLTEQPLKLHLAVLCAAIARTPLRRTQGRDVSSLIDTATRHGWKDNVSSRSVDIRNAFGHRDYCVASDGVVQLSPVRRSAGLHEAVTVTREELCDAIIGIAETCGAMELALLILCGDRIGQVTLTFSSFLTRTIAEGILGWTNVDVVTDEDEVLVIGRCHRRLKRAEIAHLAVLPLQGRTVLRLQLLCPDAVQHELRIPVDSFVAWAETLEGPRKAAAFLALNRTTTVDDQPVLDDSYVKTYVARRVMQCLSDRNTTFGAMRQELSCWRDAAKDWGYADLSKVIAAGIGWRASIETGTPRPPTFMERLEKMALEDVEQVGPWIF